MATTNSMTDFLSLDVNKTVELCPEYEEAIRKFSISPFHVGFGIKPSYAPLDVFKQVRSKYLSDSPLLVERPVVVILVERSPDEDIKSLLAALGVDSEKVNKLPTLTREDFTRGSFAPILDGTDFELIENGRVRYSALSTLYYSQNATVRSTIDQLVRDLFQSAKVLHDQAAQFPNSLSNVTVIAPVKLSEDSMKPEFTIPFQNAERSIIKDLLAEVNDRFSLQNSRESVSFSGKPVYAPLVHLTNCSGSGKTRSAFELGLLTNVLYFKFGGSNGMAESEVGKLIIQHFTSKADAPHRLDVTIELDEIIQNLLFICGQVYKRRPEKMKGVMIVDNIVATYIQMEIEEQTEIGLKLVKLSTVGQIGELLFKVNSESKYSKGTCNLYESGELGEYLQPSDLTEFNKTWLLDRMAALRSVLPESEHKDLKKTPPLIIVLDEAHNLMKEDVSFRVLCNSHIYQLDFYRLFRGTLRYFAFYWLSLCITISTVANIYNFYPAPTDDPSYRADATTPFKLHKPILLIGTFDCFREGAFNQSVIENWMKFLISRERVIFISACGRPLWGAMLAKDQCEKYLEQAIAAGVSPSQYLSEGNSNIFDYGCKDLAPVFKKLGSVVKTQEAKNTGADDFTFVNVGENESVALLALSVALQTYPAYIDIAELVRVGPFAVLDIDSNARSLTAMACSEGIFNGAASWMLLRHLEEVGKWILKWMNSVDRSMLSQGEAGEVIDRVSMIQAIQIASRNEYFALFKSSVPTPIEKTYAQFILEPIGLLSFLSAYVGEKAAREYIRQHSGLEGSFVAFSHFIYMGHDWIANHPYDVAANAFSRGAAVVPRKGSPGLDTFIPLVLKDGRISFIYMQVKMGQSYRGAPSADDMLNASPQKRFENIDPNRPYCYIFRHYNNNKRIISQVCPIVETVKLKPTKVIKVIHHQPCLSIHGPVNETLPRVFQEIVDWFVEMKCLKFLDLNFSLKNAWLDPCNLTLFKKSGRPLPRGLFTELIMTVAARGERVCETVAAREKRAGEELEEKGTVANLARLSL